MNFSKNRIKLMAIFVSCSAISYAQPSNNSFPQLTAEAFYKRGIEFHNNNDFANAASYYSEALSLNHMHTKSLYNRGMAYFELEKYNKSLIDFDALIEIAPNDALAYEQRARVLYLLNDAEGAIKDYNIILNNGATSILLVNRGMAASMLKNYEKALKDFDAALEKDPFDYEAYTNKGDVYYALGDYHNAVKFYSEALGITSNDERTLNNRGNTYLKLGKTNQALVDFNNALEIMPNSYTYVNRGFFWLAQNDLENALSDFLESSRLDYKNASAFYGIGLIKYKTEEYASALENLNKAIQLDHKNELYLNCRGLVFHFQGLFEDAILDFEQAILIKYDYSEAWFNLGQSYYLLGNKPKALENWRKALDVDPKNTEAQKRINALDSNSYNSQDEQFTAKGGDLVDQKISSQDAEYTFVEGETKTDESFLQKTVAFKAFASEELDYPEHTIIKKSYIPNKIPHKSVIQDIETPAVDFYSLKANPDTSAFENKGHNEKYFLDNAKALTLEGEYQKAILNYNSALEINGENPSALLSRGKVHFYLQNFQSAIEDFSKAVTFDSALTEAYFERGNVFFDLNDYKKASHDFSIVINHDPTFAEAYYLRGICFTNRNNYKKALKDFNQCFLLDPSNTKALNNIATLNFISGNIFESVEGYTLAIEKSPSESVLYVNRAKAYQALKMHEDALKDCQTAIDLGSKNEEVYFLCGLIKYDLKDYTESIVDFSFAIQNSPNERSEYFYRRAVSFHFLGLSNKALEDYNKTILLDPNNAEAFYKRGLIKKESGDHIGCNEDLKKAKGLGFKNLNDSMTTNLTKENIKHY